MHGFVGVIYLVVECEIKKCYHVILVQPRASFGQGAVGAESTQTYYMHDSG
jgi:hypothetical protein